MAKNTRGVSAKKGKGGRGSKGVRGGRGGRGGGVRSESVLQRQMSRSPSPFNLSDESLSESVSGATQNRRGGGDGRRGSVLQRQLARSSSPILLLNETLPGAAQGGRGGVPMRGRSVLTRSPSPSNLSDESLSAQGRRGGGTWRSRSVFQRQPARSPSLSEESVSGATQRRRGGGDGRRGSALQRLLNETLSGAAQEGRGGVPRRGRSVLERMLTRSPSTVDLSDVGAVQGEEGRGDNGDGSSLNLSRDSLPELPPQCFQPTLETYFTPQANQANGRGVAARRNGKKAVGFIDDTDDESNMNDSPREDIEDSCEMDESTPEDDVDSCDKEGDSDKEFAKEYGLDDEDL